MKKTNKVILILIAIVAALIITGTGKVEAASASITDSKTVTVGTPVTVSASVTAGSWELVLSGPSGTKNFSDYSSQNDNETKSESLSFTPGSTGSYTFTLKGNITDYNTEQKSNINKSCTITVVDPPKEEQPEQSASTVRAQATPERSSSQDSSKSSNNYLKSLSTSVGALAPDFYRGTTDYTLEFAPDFDLKALTSVTVSASAEDSKASVSGTGEKTLEDGENILQVVCTAENGSARTYNIKVVKPTPLVQSDLRLKMLEVNTIDTEGFFTKATLNIPFDPEKFEYELNVGKDVTALDVDARVEKEGIIVKIEGANDLNSGENQVKIILTSQDDKEIQTTYIIKVKKEAEEKSETEEKNGIMGIIKKLGYKKLLIIIGSVIGLLVLILIILIIVNHKKKKAKKSTIEYKGNNDEEGAVIENQEGEDVEELSSITEEENVHEEDESPYSNIDYSNLSSEDYDYARFKELYDKRGEDSRPIYEEKKPETEESQNNETIPEDNILKNNAIEDKDETEENAEIKPILGENEKIFNTSYDDEDYKVDINHDFIAYKDEPIDLKEQKKLNKQRRKEAAKRQALEDKEEKKERKSRGKRHKGKHF